MPARSEIMVGRDATGRVLRMSSHPEAGRVVLSIWQDARCMATFRLAPGDVPELAQALISLALANEADSAALPPEGFLPDQGTGTYGPTPV